MIDQPTPDTPKLEGIDFITVIKKTCITFAADGASRSSPAQAVPMDSPFPNGDDVGFRKQLCLKPSTISVFDAIGQIWYELLVTCPYYENTTQLAREYNGWIQFVK